MRFTYNWLRQFLKTELTPKELAPELTKLGLELEEMIDRSKDLAEFKVGYIEEALPHPNADKLKVCKVNNGTEILQIVCGANNARSGIKVVLSTPGCVIPNGNFVIKASEIRGVKSQGMLCSADEIMVSFEQSKDGIIELPNDAKIGDGILSYLGLDDVIYDVSVTPNRGDWLGVYGIARDLAAKNIGQLIQIEFPKLEESFECTVTAEIDSPECPFLSLREIRGAKNGDSPHWLQKLLRMVGIEPISSIVDITNYISISFARPLHAYDKSSIGNSLCAKNIASGHNFLALNGKEYELSSGDLVIASDEKIHSIAGIIGGEQSKCKKTVNSDELTSIILESASFDRIAASKAGRKHDIITDSRSRFERGVDDSMALEYANLATKMILDICGGSCSNPSFVGALPNSKSIDFDINIIEKRIGLKVLIPEMKDILRKLGFKILIEKDSHLNLSIPLWRHDINCPEVIAEEITRIIGYENIPLKAPVQIGRQNKSLKIFPQLFTKEQKRLEGIRRFVASLGFNEIISWSFMSSKMAEHFEKIDQKMCIINPISTDLDYMRPSIMPNLLSSASLNMKRSIYNIAFFEIGPAFFGLNPEDEKLMISALISGEAVAKSHARDARLVDIFDIKSYLNSIFEELGFEISKMRISAEAPKYYHPGRSGSYIIGNKVVCYFGEIHPKVQEIYSINSRTYGFEIFLNDVPLQRSKFGKRPIIQISPYQMVTRDFAFLLNKEIQAGELTKLISSIDSLIKNVEIFDLYTGGNIEEGKKSIALRLSIQAYDRTLTDKEIDSISLNLISRVSEKLGGVLR